MGRVKSWTEPEIEAAREILLSRLSVALHFRRLTSRSAPMIAQVVNLSGPELVEWINTELTHESRRDLLVALRVRKHRK
jgi:hypothetical protein